MFDMIPDMARKRAQLSPDAPAFEDGGKVWSFAQVNRAADAIAQGLRNAGFEEGDRIAILCLNRVEFFLTLFACQKTGMILCPLNWRQPAAELVETLEPIDARLILHSGDFAEVAREIGADLGVPVFDIDGDMPNWLALDPEPSTDLIPGHRPWYLLFTSGTTGRPKAVIQTATMAWANALNIGQAIDLVSTDRSVNFLPLFHTAGINLHTLPVFLFGGFSRILPKFEPETLLDLFRAGEITQFLGVPAIYQAFSLAESLDGIDWTRATLSCGGAPLPEPLIRFFADRGAVVLNGFGMTETGPTVFLMDRAGAETKIGSVGRAQMLTEMRLDGVADGAEGQGEILMRGPNITPGYFENAEATAAAFTEDGWLKSGDVGRRDGDGYVYIVDRIKDMYISGGENVYPAEVERVLHGHPAILESAVIGVADPKWGEVGAAFVMLRPCATLDTSTLTAWCRERLAAYKCPASFTVLDDFPRTAAGKIRKPDLRELHDPS